VAAVSVASARPQSSLYRVTFFDGRSITVAAANSLVAEAKACRQHPGFVRTVKFLRKVEA